MTQMKGRDIIGNMASLSISAADAEVDPTYVQKRVEELWNPDDVTRMPQFFCELPVDMSGTFIDGIRWQPSGGGEMHLLDEAIYHCRPVITPYRPVQIMVEDNKRGTGPHHLRADPLAPSTFWTTAHVVDRPIVVQYAQQDGGCVIRPECTYVLTPALTGCKFFMLRLGIEAGQYFAFHLNNTDNWRSFIGVAENMHERVAGEIQMKLDRCAVGLAQMFHVQDAADSPVETLAKVLQHSEVLEALSGGYASLPEDLPPDYMCQIRGHVCNPEILTALIKMPGDQWNLVQSVQLRDPFIPKFSKDKSFIVANMSRSRLNMVNPPDFVEGMESLWKGKMEELLLRGRPALRV